MSARKKVVPKVTEPEYPKVFETFRDLSSYHLNQMRQTEPSCFNGFVSVEKYRITIEKIDEPLEVVAQRLNKLWRECDNYHHTTPLRMTAKRLGIELDSAQYGKDRKPRAY